MPVGKSSILRAAQAQKADSAKNGDLKKELACAEAPETKEKKNERNKKNELPYYLL